MSAGGGDFPAVHPVPALGRHPHLLPQCQAQHGAHPECLPLGQPLGGIQGQPAVPWTCLEGVTGSCQVHTTVVSFSSNLARCIAFWVDSAQQKFILHRFWSISARQRRCLKELRGRSQPISRHIQRSTQARRWWLLTTQRIPSSTRSASSGSTTIQVSRLDGMKARWHAVLLRHAGQGSRLVQGSLPASPRIDPYITDIDWLV